MASAASPPVALPEKFFLPHILNSWPAEFELLLACCSGGSGVELDPKLDWDGFVALAEHHGVIPQVYECLSRTSGVPESAMAALCQRHEHNARRTLWLTRELGRILEHLEARGIWALPYKGPVLAEMLYGNVTSRQFSDLDVIVRAEDVSPAKIALRDLGYESNLHLTVRQERAYLRSGYEYSFDSVHGRNLLEVQWQILPRFYAVDFAMDGLFERALKITVGGATVQTLSSEDLVLALCVHAAKHAWARLSWLCDIARLSQAPVDWKFVRAEAGRLGVKRIVGITFCLIEKFLGVGPPLKADGESMSLADEVSGLVAGGTELDLESLTYFRLMMRIREQRRDRVRFASRLLMTPSVGEWEAVGLPDWLFPLYRGVRLVRVARRLASR